MAPKAAEDVRIVILQRGWVMVGNFSKKGSTCTLDHASVIRRWGTTKGIGELTNGPTKGTLLDRCNGKVEFHELTIVASINVNPEKWSTTILGA